jgi:8-oxo-dGTP pyrophosphatase MutT (NUDIX family)
MKRLLTIHRQPGLNPKGTTLFRKAYRAIIFREEKLLLIRSRKYGEYKFPGGGQHDHEVGIDVLRREVAEETGYFIYSRIIPYGSTMEYAKDFEGKFDIFKQYSLYYICQVHTATKPLALEDYEIEYGYAPIWISIEEAIRNNRNVPSNDRIPWKERDTAILELLKNGR